MSGPRLPSPRPKSLRSRPRRARALGLGVLAGGLLLAGLGSIAASAVAAPTTMVDLGTASTYAVLSGASVANTVSADGAPHTTLRGDLGVKANAQPSGFPPGVVTGTVEVGNATSAQAHADAVTAYANVAGRTGGTALAGALAGKTIGPGLHTIAGAVSNTTTVTLDAGGDPNAVFVFQVNGAMAMAAGSQVVLAGGAQASRVFWQVNGAGAVGANASFAGTLIATDAVALGNGTILNGRAFALNGALTLDANEVYSSAPLLTINGGTEDTTTDTTPTISGTTDVVTPGAITVTVAGQTLTAIPSGGTWSVTSAILANATYPVVASTTNGAGSVATTTQQLTVDTVPPVVSLDGGAAVTTNDPTPTIAGVSDVAPGTIVHVTVGTQTLTALVQLAGTWNVTPATLSDATRTVTASVDDPAGNEGTDTQQLTVDTTAPAAAIAGGTTALTNDATPTISGTADVAPGTTVTVDLADETLTGLVQSGGTWSVVASALADGPHRVVLAVSDDAGNPTRFTQTLTVDTVSPLVAITGGATASTSDTAPTVTGTSDAAPGTTVTVTIAGQTMTTLLQGNGTWNATPTVVGEGTWPVVASVPDPAGNVGSAEQTLTIVAPAAQDAGGGGGGDSGGGGSTGGGGGGTGASQPSATAQTTVTATAAPAPTVAAPAAAKPAGAPAAKPALKVSLAASFRAVRGKHVRVAFTLTAPAKLTLTIVRGKKVVAKLTLTRRTAGRAALTWNGKVKGKLAPRGTYKMTMQATPTTGKTARDTATLRIT